MQAEGLPNGPGRVTPRTARTGGFYPRCIPGERSLFRGAFL